MIRILFFVVMVWAVLSAVTGIVRAFWPQKFKKHRR